MHPIFRSSFSSLSSFLSRLAVFIIEYSEVRNLGAHSLCLIVFLNVRSWLGNELRGGNKFPLRHFRSIFLNFQKTVLSCSPRNTRFSPPHWDTVSLCKIYCFDNILFYFSLQTLNHNLDLCSHGFSLLTDLRVEVRISLRQCCCSTRKLGYWLVVDLPTLRWHPGYGISHLRFSSVEK